MIPGSSVTVGEGEQHVGEVKHATRFSSAKELPFMSFGPVIGQVGCSSQAHCDHCNARMSWVWFLLLFF